jgi:hypothetical protein
LYNKISLRQYTIDSVISDRFFKMNPTTVIIAIDAINVAYEPTNSYYKAALIALAKFEAADTTFKAAYETLCVKRHGALEVNEIAHKYFMGIVDVIVAIRMGPSEANPIYKSLDKYEDVINTICDADAIYEFLASNTPHTILVK